MRLLKRHADEDAAPAEGGEAASAESGADPSKTEAVVGSRRTTRPAATNPPVAADTTPVTERTAEITPETETARAGRALRFRRTLTVPMTVPRRAVRRTVSIPSRRAAPSAPPWGLAPMLSTLAGAALAVVGLVVLIRAGLNETWFQPRVEVLDATHTPLLGAIEIGAGALLIILGLAGSRVLVAMAGIAGALVATAAAVEPEELNRELAIESWWAWVLAGVGVTLTLVALQAPRPRPETVVDLR